MNRRRWIAVAVAAVISLGTAGCLTVSVPQCNAPSSAAATRPAGVPTGTPASTPAGNTAVATQTAALRPSAGPSRPAGVTSPLPAGAPASAAPVAGQPPATAPAALPTTTPAPAAGGTSPNSPHPADWVVQHGLQVKAAGGVSKATITGGISCTTCHTTQRSPDGTVARSPVATYTCFSCHDGPNGPVP